MPTVAQYISSIKDVDNVVKQKTEGLTHADSMLQLSVPANCMNWNIGHIVIYREVVISRINKGATTPDEAMFKLYGYESEPLTDADKAIPLETLLAKMESSSAELIAMLETMPEGRLAEPFNDEDKTLDDNLFFYIVWHEAYHAGQFEALRELADAQNK